MNNRIHRILTALMAIVVCCTALTGATLAETADAQSEATTQAPEQISPEQGAQAPDTGAAPAEEPAPADEQTATASGTEQSELSAAYEAYQTARRDNATAELKAELDAMVAAGQLTQEQADLILNDRQSRTEQQCNGSCRNGGKGLDNGSMGRGNNGMGRGNGSMGPGNGGMGRNNNGCGVYR